MRSEEEIKNLIDTLLRERREGTRFQKFVIDLKINLLEWVLEGEEK